MAIHAYALCCLETRVLQPQRDIDREKGNDREREKERKKERKKEREREREREKEGEREREQGLLLLVLRHYIAGQYIYIYNIYILTMYYRTSLSQFNRSF